MSVHLTRRISTAKLAARIVVTALTVFTAACGHLSLFEDKPSAAQSAPSRKPAHKAQDKQQTAALRTTNEESAQAAAATQRAARLRSQALEQMNRGAIDDAVGNLKQAAELDPHNALIRRDLDRALRIQSTVQAKPS